jgi:hypothetical protein
VETVEKIQGDPQFSMYPAFSEQSNLWRQQRLYEAYHDVVEHINSKSYESDPLAAQLLLSKLKHFVVVYDLFENHYDAVVNAIMLSEGKWVEADQMLPAAMTCRRVISDSKRVNSATLVKKRSTVSATAPSQRLSTPVASFRR